MDFYKPLSLSFPPPHHLSSSDLLLFPFQIDHALLQQTLQQGGLLSQPLSIDTGLVSHSGNQLMSATDPSMSANVVIHPLTSLALQPSSITPTQVTMASLSEQDATGMCGGKSKTLSVVSRTADPRFPVDAAGSQDLSHVIGSSGLVAGGPSGQEITLTINNSSLSQALAQVHAQASASGSSAAAGNPQEITLTISGNNNTKKNSSLLYSYSVCSQVQKRTIIRQQIQSPVTLY